ncbi:D-alanyl-D-alanine carboxypeptidase [Candidatus Gottesmanbacteria bacterium]|nr:D-alanyl-D-alanine carboxypeptidase [Candidatus Gottesmanbacteria bacterium]
MKKNIRQHLSFKTFVLELKEKPIRYSIFFSLFLFLLFLPGQNYYQTLFLIKKEPTFITFPFSLPAPALYPKITGKDPIPFLTAQGAILIDVDSQVVLYAKNPHLRLYPASTTKIMTAVTAMENYAPDAILTAWESISEASTDAALVGLKSGDRVSLKGLLYGLLLNSGADAAETLSQNFPGGKKAFILEMNKKAQSLHLRDTHFVNESGLDDKDQYTSVLDLARFTTYALKKPLFAEIVGTKELFITDISGKKRYYLKNINKLLGEVWGVNGVKTGYTEKAGECLVAQAERNSHRLLSVMLNSLDRFAETQAFLEWGFQNITWENSLLR